MTSNINVTLAKSHLSLRRSIYDPNFGDAPMKSYTWTKKEKTISYPISRLKYNSLLFKF